MNAGEDCFEYYDQLSAEVRQILAVKGQSNLCPSLVFNPGTSVIEKYMPLADVFATFEGSADDYAKHTPSEYVQQYPVKKFWHIVYDAECQEMQEVLLQFKSKHAAWIYVTHLGLPNPYNALPEAPMWTSQQNIN